MTSERELQPPSDDGLRGNVGVVISIRQEADGRFRLFIDDVEALSSGRNRDWRKWSFVTSTLLSKEEIFDHQILSDRARGIGDFIVARLGALYSVRGEGK